MLSTEITVALIGLVGAVGAALITAYAHDLKALITGKFNRDRDLLGEWHGTWIIESSGPEQTIRDIVTIKNVSGERIRAVGQIPGIGKFPLSGRVTLSNLVTFFYEGVEGGALGGVAILELGGSRNEMNGYWVEYDDERKFTSGTVRWRKTGGSDVQAPHARRKAPGPSDAANRGPS